MNDIRTLSDIEIIDVIRRYNHGYRIKDIARYYKCRLSTISSALKNNGINVKRARVFHFNAHYDYFDVIDTKNKAYMLGFLFADGNVRYDSDGREPILRVEISEGDCEVLYMLADELNVNNRIRRNERAGRNPTCSYSLRSSHIVESLAQYGVVPRKTYVTNHLPDIPDWLVPSFLHGLIDGDGSVYYSQNTWHINFCSHSQTICEDFERLCTNLIQKPTHMKTQCSNGVYRITYNGRWAKRLANFCFTDNYGIARKRLLAEQMLKEDVVEDIVYSSAKVEV